MTLTEQVVDAINIIIIRCPEQARNALKLREVVQRDVRNPLILKRFGALIDNARNEYVEWTREEAARLGEALYDLNVLQDKIQDKPRHPELYPMRVDLRIGVEEEEALRIISERTQENKSEIIRRLINEERAKNDAL